ncbi:MAG: hypothetical protein PHU52_04940 [Dehalococcoidales bacterium]|nr:hypothetical protein [Dehalococcoidales bacterium]
MAKAKQNKKKSANVASVSAVVEDQAKTDAPTETDAAIPEPEKTEPVTTPATEKPEDQPIAQQQSEEQPTPLQEQQEEQPITLKSLYTELQSLKTTVSQLQEQLAKKRKPVTSNGKIKIRDTKTGKVYPSKNNVYQTLLKSGELKELVDKGVFGDVPEKNTFGCYVLFREFPGRFVEVKDEDSDSESDSGSESASNIASNTTKPQQEKKAK